MRRIQKLLLLAGIFCLLMACVPASAVFGGTMAGNKKTEVRAVNKKGLVKEKGSYYFYVKGKKFKNGWKTIDGSKYYFQKNGKACTYGCQIGDKAYVFDKAGKLVRPKKTSFVTVGKRMYYVNKKGIARTGWFILNDRLYHANYKGRIWTNRTHEGVVFGGKGKAKNNTAARLKMKTMNIVASITNNKMSSSQKLYACWRYMVSTGGFRYWSKYPNLNQKGWQKSTALDMLMTKKGNCYSFACAFAALAAEVGYRPYVVCGRVMGSRDGAADGMTRHAWVKIDGRHYDPEAQFAGWYTGVYNNYGYNIYHTVQRIVDFRKSV